MGNEPTVQPNAATTTPYNAIDTEQPSTSPFRVGGLEVEGAVGHRKRPFIHGFQYRTQTHSQGRKFIDDPRRDLRVGRSCHQLVGLELPKPAGERMRAYPAEAIEKFVEATRTLEKVPDNQGCPGAIEQAEEAGNTALLQRAMIELHDCTHLPLLQLM